MKAPIILVVEDEQLVALDISRRLERLGYAVITSSSGEDAIENAPRARPDLILMDIKLNGGIDGIDATCRIHEALDVPVIYLTAYADETTLERARLSEPYGYVLKPFDERELRATIEMALQRHWTDMHRKEQEELQHFLADASAHLTSSLDYEKVARDAAALLVPRYADWCQLCLVRNDDFVPSFTLTHPSLGATENGHAPHGALVEAVLESGLSQLHAHVPDRETLAELLHPDHAAALTLGGAQHCSVLCVPIRLTLGPTVGTLTLASTRQNHQYSTADLVRAEDFAHRLSMATDNALLYLKARRAIHMREEVLAVVSHDLRTPLSAILMRAELLARGELVAGAPQAIARTARTMNRLINDLLDAAATDAGRLALKRETQSASKLVKDAIDMLQPLAVEKQINLVDASSPANAICDRDRIIQVLSNLIGNAIKFTPQGGAVTVTSFVQGPHVRFEISDTGAGITPEDVPKLFERFWRAGGRRDGAGLGLFIARGIVEAHGGRIGVDSGTEPGARFYFTLPSGQLPSAQLPASQLPSALAPRDPYTVRSG